MVKGHDWPTFAGNSSFVWPNTDPVHFAVQTLRPGLWTHSADTNHRFEVPRSYSPHAVMNAKLSRYVGISVVGPLVDECAHSVCLDR